MRNRTFVPLLLASAAVAGCDSRQAGNEAASNEIAAATEGFILEGYPDAVADSLAQHDEAMAELAEEVSDGNASLSSVIISRQDRWEPGSVVRVAFNGGNPALYARIEQAAQQWTQPGLANVTLSFRDEQGRFRKWSTQDAQRAAEIRVAFKRGTPDAGHWSLIGVKSIDPTIVGGGRRQASMNLQLTAQNSAPANFEGTVIHEFGHALGFLHEHQSPAIQCGFRFDNDPGYIETTNEFEEFINDPQGRRPGLYTLLGGPPNRWPPAKVDRNLRTLAPSPGIEVGPYDRQSIMEYFFEPWMFAQGNQSPCYIEREGTTLSAQDRIAVARAYPASDALAEQLESRIEADTRALARAVPDNATIEDSLEARLSYRRSTTN
jgi:hypothetical protein